MNHHILLPLLLSLFLSILHGSYVQSQDNPVRIAVAGLTHDHVHWLFGREGTENDIEIAGIFEPDEELWQRYRDMYNLDPKLHYNNLEEMFDQTQPDAVTGFGSTFDHLSLVQASAPRGIHIMVEKPLAVTYDHAVKMKKLADQNNVHLITNYETTWYASNHEVYRMFREDDRFGKIRKIVVHDGHQGPKEIGVSAEFLDWLTDPVLNGGGAIMDFGCYGANLITWLMDGQVPVSVTAVTQTHKPDTYPGVDDEATIILTYPGVQGIIQASWNWPFSRKDMYTYGETGTIFSLDSVTLETQKKEEGSPKTDTLQPLGYPYNDPFSYLAEVVRGEITIKETDLSSLENNMIVMKILDAAKKSAQSGETIYLNN